MKRKVRSDSNKEYTPAGTKSANNLRTTRRFLLTSPITAFAVIMFLLFASVAFSQTQTRRGVRGASSDDTPGISWTGDMGIQRRTAEIMDSQVIADIFAKPEFVRRRLMPTNPRKAPNDDAPAVAQSPEEVSQTEFVAPELSIHTLGSAFNGPTLTDTGAFPPDSMGTIGPAQFIAFTNGRIRSYTKTGVADGVINADPDVFYAPVMTPVAPPVVLNFTSDPEIRYDRFTARWFMSIIEVPCTNATCTTTAPNRWLVAVSDAASGGVISGSTVWTLFQFQADPGTNFCDYPSLGIDVNALYMGCNVFSSAGAFVGTNGYVIRKSSILGAGPIFTTMFANLAAGAGAGPESPRGVDNFDPGATEGYFVGPDNATFSTIMFRRISNPGSAAPTISANISVTVSTTTAPNRVEHAGNTGGLNGGLDSLDDRFFQAMIRNGRMWTAHNFRVSAAGVANTAAQSRNAVRWYEFQNLTTTPTVRQSGTVFDNAATRAAARQYWIPTITVTGQGHSVMGMTMAGTPVGATPVFVGRLAGDTLGTMTGPPTTAAVTFGTTTANYNPPSDPGGASGRRWGDYSFTVVDPLDDMTVWSAQEYNQASNSYAVRIGRLAAPPPAAPTAAAPASEVAGQASVNVIVTGVSAGGSGFYDPGANLLPPALPFNHVGAAITGGVTVNSVTFNSPTQVTLNISTVGATPGLQNITITNPDGQSATGIGTLTILAPTAALVSISGRVQTSAGRGIANAIVTVADSNGAPRSVRTSAFGYYSFSNLQAGGVYVLNASARLYRFNPRAVNLTDDLTGFDLTAEP